MVFLVAEAGINHNGNIDEAKMLIKYAKESGADAVKFQSYDTYLRVKADNPAYDILKKCEIGRESHIELIKYAKEVDIEFFSTPFDEDWLCFLVSNGIKRIKISSFDITNKTFLRAINKYGKDIKVILSTGMANEGEISEAFNCLSDIRDKTLLYCISSYPIKYECDLHFSSIARLKSLFGNEAKIGYSNHHKSAEIPALSVIAGAEVIECHFMYKHDCVDRCVSLNIGNFSRMERLVRRYEKIMGEGDIKMKDVEKDALAFRRETK